MCVSVSNGSTQVAVLEGRSLIEHYLSRPADDISEIHGNIYLGKDLELKELKVNGNFNISVSKDLPIVAIGKVETPAAWIGATIGYLNQANDVYKLKIIVEDGSVVKFFDENGGS